MALCYSYILAIPINSISARARSQVLIHRLNSNCACKQMSRADKAKRLNVFFSAFGCLVNENDYYLRMAQHLLIFSWCCEHLQSKTWLVVSVWLFVSAVSCPLNHGISQRRKLKTSSMPGHSEVKVALKQNDSETLLV